MQQPATKALDPTLTWEQKNQLAELTMQRVQTGLGNTACVYNPGLFDTVTNHSITACVKCPLRIACLANEAQDVRGRGRELTAGCLGGFGPEKRRVLYQQIGRVIEAIKASNTTN